MNGVGLLPDGYTWSPSKGIVRRTKKESIQVCDAMPQNVRAVNIVEAKTGTAIEAIRFDVLSVNDVVTPGVELSVDDVARGKFMAKLVGVVLVAPRHASEAADCWRFMLLAARKTQPPIVEEHRSFGWNGTFFHWNEAEPINSEAVYSATMRVCQFLTREHCMPICIFLDALHGLMAKPLADAGIHHRFTAVYLGETGVGKTDAVKKICFYGESINNAISLGSKRQAIRQSLSTFDDMTVIIDDLACSDSDRVAEHLNQVVAELIQAASDSARVLVDDGCEMLPSNRSIHLVLTAERMLKNISTRNRCVIVNVTEPLNTGAFREMRALYERGDFLMAYKGFTDFLGNAYARQIDHLRANFDFYLHQAESLGTCGGSSDHRLDASYAVQRIILKSFCDYLQHIEAPREIASVIAGKRLVLDEIFCDMKTAIQNDRSDEKYLRYLRPLASLVCSLCDDASFGGRLAVRSEKRFLNANKERATALLLHPGYVSFREMDVVTILREEYGIEDATRKGLALSLAHYQLARADGEGKVSCRWQTKHRYIHIRAAELLDHAGVDLDASTTDWVLRFIGGTDPI